MMFSPREIISELNRFIIGQEEAKRAVAVALRNRWRRMQVPPPMRDEILPKNILMIGPTGVGKTEMARRLSHLDDAPFVKVEATKFTEVGYVGRDVEQIIRDLVDVAIAQTRERTRQKVTAQAELATEQKLIQALSQIYSTDPKQLLQQLRTGALDDQQVDVNVKESPAVQMPSFELPGMTGAHMVNMQDIIGKMMGGDKQRQRKMTVKEAKARLLEEECDKHIDEDELHRSAIEIVQERGIVFIDEIDKTCRHDSAQRGGDVSREGVQRDLLPLIEGTIVTTRYGAVRTDHILFIASGAFHGAKPSDLMPELQGRLPVRVRFKPLSSDDFFLILTEPENNLVRQYQSLLRAEQVELDMDEDAIVRIAQLAADVNDRIENIGARRLHALMERVLEDISFEAGDSSKKKFHVTKAYVDERMQSFIEEQDLSRFIL